MLPLVVSSGFLVAGCSDSGTATASDFEGLWLIASVTAQVGTSTETVQRDGTALAVRGDVVFAASTERTGVVSIRQVLLEDEVPQGPLISREDEVVLDGQKWVLTEETGRRRRAVYNPHRLRAPTRLLSVSDTADFQWSLDAFTLA